MSDQFKLMLSWLVCGSVAFAVAMLFAPITFEGGAFNPVGPDSLYHARRILDTAASPGDFYQFDPRIHAPQGSWLTWPWAYDYGVAWLVRAVLAVRHEWQAETVLAYIPAFWVFVNTWLVLQIGGAIGLRLPLRIVAGLCFALSPLTQNLHGVGRVDHHFIEHSFVLAVLYVGLLWTRNQDRVPTALCFGLLMGIASAFHNSLFVLQIPILLWMFVTWWREEPISVNGVCLLAGGLLVGGVIAVLPAETFRAGFFSFYYLSSFHLYVTSASALALLVMCRFAYSKRMLGMLCVMAVVLLMALVEPVRFAYQWLALDLANLSELNELRSIVRDTGTGQLQAVVVLSLYSGLICLLPLTLLAIGWRLIRGRRDGNLFFWIACLYGTVFMPQQIRFHYMGSFVLYLPVLLGFQHLFDSLPRFRAALVIGGTCLLGLAYWLPLVYLASPLPSAWGFDYLLTRDLYPRLAQACKERPGVVLANYRDGHAIRFHTDCSVIANSMIVTRQHHLKVRQSEALLAKSAAEIRDQEPWITYVLVSRIDDRANAGTNAGAQARGQVVASGLGDELLQPGKAHPRGYELIAETNYESAQHGAVPMARVFRVHRDRGAQDSKD